VTDLKMHGENMKLNMKIELMVTGIRNNEFMSDLLTGYCVVNVM